MTTAQAYRALTDHELTGRKLTKAERDAMFSEFHRMGLLRGRLWVAVNFLPAKKPRKASA